MHLDLDAFYCAVEVQRDPSLHGKPFAVGGQPTQRGVVASASYAARQVGIHSAMPMAQAVRLCPDLLIVPPDFSAYRATSLQVMERLYRLTPLLEQISIDEGFVDVTLLHESGTELAAHVQATIRNELGLSCSLGVATNKLVAKIATDVGKSLVRSGSMPSAICVVPAGEEATFLAPLPATALWGVGPRTGEKLAALGMDTIGAIAAWPATNFIRRFGQHGEELTRHARGIDQRPIVAERTAKSISQETTFAVDVTDRATLERVLHEQATTIAQQLRHNELMGTTVKLKIRWPDFTTPTRQSTVPEPTDAADAIVQVALRLFGQIWPEGQAVRLIGVGVNGLGTPPRQLTLWDAPPTRTPDQIAREQRMQAALAAIHARFGPNVVAS